MNYLDTNLPRIFHISDGKYDAVSEYEFIEKGEQVIVIKKQGTPVEA